MVWRAASMAAMAVALMAMLGAMQGTHEPIMLREDEDRVRDPASWRTMRADQLMRSYRYAMGYGDDRLKSVEMGGEGKKSKTSGIDHSKARDMSQGMINKWSKLNRQVFPRSFEEEEEASSLLHGHGARVKLHPKRIRSHRPSSPHVRTKHAVLPAVHLNNGMFSREEAKREDKRFSASQELSNYANLNNQIFSKSPRAARWHKETADEELASMQRLSSAVLPPRTRRSRHALSGSEELTHLKHLNDEIFPKANTKRRWHRESADQELNSFAKLNQRVIGARHSSRSSSHETADDELSQLKAESARVVPQEDTSSKF